MLFYMITFFSLHFCNVESQKCGINKYMRPELPIGQRIIGGTTAREGAWPWLVALATWRTASAVFHTQAYFKCGGSLITNRHVLTAAHCCDDNLYLARLGASYLHSVNVDTIDVLIERVVIHQDFDVTQAYNDIALVILSEKVKFNENIRPICLPKNSLHSDDSLENITYVIAGWGDVKYGSETGSNLLQEVRLPIYDLKECQQIYKKYDTNVTSKNICVGFKSKGKDACQGDSGGPLMARVPSETSYILIGVISHGLGCGLEGIPGVYTRVSPYLPWIDKTLRATKAQQKKHKRYKMSEKMKRFNLVSSRAKYRRYPHRGRASFMKRNWPWSINLVKSATLSLLFNCLTLSDWKVKGKKGQGAIFQFFTRGLIVSYKARSTQSMKNKIRITKKPMTISTYKHK